MSDSRAVQGAIKRTEERPSNNLPVEAYQARESGGPKWDNWDDWDNAFGRPVTKREAFAGWNNWPDWDNGPDFPNWGDQGGPPPK